MASETGDPFPSRLRSRHVRTGVPLGRCTDRASEACSRSTTVALRHPYVPPRLSGVFSEPMCRNACYDTTADWFVPVFDAKAANDGLGDVVSESGPHGGAEFAKQARESCSSLVAETSAVSSPAASPLWDGVMSPVACELWERERTKKPVRCDPLERKMARGDALSIARLMGPSHKEGSLGVICRSRPPGRPSRVAS